MSSESESINRRIGLISRTSRIRFDLGPGRDVAHGAPEAEATHLLEQVNRVERQAVLLLRALHSIYLALGAFAAATLVTLLGEGLAFLWGALWFRAMAGLGIALGMVGVGGLVFGSVKLFKATRMSLDNIHAEGALIRQRQSQRKASASNRAGDINRASQRVGLLLRLHSRRQSVVSLKA